MASENSYQKLLFKIATLFPGAAEAEVICTALGAARPKDLGPSLQSAYANILRGNHDIAVSTLRDKVLSVDPENGMARVYCALALCCKGDIEAAKAKLHGVEAGTDALAAKAAEALGVLIQSNEWS